MTVVETFQIKTTGETAEILDLIIAERQRQEAKCAAERAECRNWRTCADPTLDDGTRLAVLGEEFGEVAKTICDEIADEYCGDSRDENRRRALKHRLEELVQVAAVSTSWAEAIMHELEGRA